MTEQKRYAFYLVHRRSEHDYREWIIMPATSNVPVNVWTRYINHEGARPTWRGTKNPPNMDVVHAVARSKQALDMVASTIAGHYRQNERNAGRGDKYQWKWDAPVIVETKDSEITEHWRTTPYPVLNRIKRVLARRAEHGVTIDVDKSLETLAKSLTS